MENMMRQIYKRLRNFIGVYIGISVFVLNGCDGGPVSNIAHAFSSQKISPPSKGCYVGMFPGWGEAETSVSAKELHKLETLVGKAIAFSPFSNNWGEHTPLTSTLNEIASYGAVPMVRLLPWESSAFGAGDAYQAAYSLQNIIDGEFDSFLLARAEEIKRFGKPVMITFGVEMNGDWFPWCGVFQGGNVTTAYGDSTKADGPERYIDTFRHIVNVFRNREVNNVTWYFHPNAMSLPEESWNAMTAYYPGDDYVDWIGVSVYGPQSRDEDWESFETIMDPAYHALASHLSTKPLMLPEWGVGEWPKKGDKAAWYRAAFHNIQSRYPEIKIAVVYHETWQNDDGTTTDLRIDSSPEALRAYQQGIRSDYFLGHYIE